MYISELALDDCSNKLFHNYHPGNVKTKFTIITDDSDTASASNVEYGNISSIASSICNQSKASVYDVRRLDVANVFDIALSEVRMVFINVINLLIMPIIGH